MNYDLGNNVEILFIIFKKLFDQIEYEGNHARFKLGVIQDKRYFKDLLFHYFLLMRAFLFIILIKLVKIALKLLDMAFDFVLYRKIDTTIFSPIFTFFVKFFKCFLQKHFITFTKIFNICFK